MEKVGDEWEEEQGSAFPKMNCSDRMLAVLPAVLTEIFHVSLITSRRMPAKYLD
jgi:hypothetical protein